MEARVQYQIDLNREEHERLIRRLKSMPNDEEEPTTEQSQLEEEY